MRFFNSVKALYAAVGILFLTFVLGYYLDVQSAAMNRRHLEISIELERMVRLDQELASMLSMAVVEQNELRATRYETVRQEVEASIQKVVYFTKDQRITQEIVVMSEGNKKIRDIEAKALQQMRAGWWKEAGKILFGDEYLSAKKTYEMDGEIIPGLVRGELNVIEKRFKRFESGALAARIIALCLLLWTGILFSRRTQADLAEQVRLRAEISAANEALEARVQERTREVESTLHKINAMSQAIDDALVMIDSQGKVLFWNLGAEKLFGYTAAEAMGSDFHDMAVPPEYKEKYQTGIKLFAATGQGVVFGAIQETTANDRMGRTFPVEVSLSPFQVDQEWFAVGTVRDITERKALEQKIIAEGEQFKIILDTAPVCIAFSTQGKIYFANPLYSETFGAKVGDESPQLYVDPDKRKAMVEQLKRDGILKDFEIQMFNRHKEVRDMLITYLPLNFQGEDGLLRWLTDITERKQAEKKLNERMEDLERFTRLTIKREGKMIQLKEEINSLLVQMGQEKKYKVVE